jgi:hypothetical protein
MARTSSQPRRIPRSLEELIEAARVSSEVPGLDGAEVLRRLAVLYPRDKWSQVTRITWDASGLKDIVPPDQRAEAESRLGRTMWDAYFSRGVADHTFQAGQAEIRTIRQEVETTGRLASPDSDVPVVR